MTHSEPRRLGVFRRAFAPVYSVVGAPALTWYHKWYHLKSLPTAKECIDARPKSGSRMTINLAIARWHDYKQRKKAGEK